MVASKPPLNSPVVPSNGDLASSEPLSMGAVLRFPMMRHLWYAQIISVFGDFLALYAVIGVLTFKLHASAKAVTGVQIAYLLPIAILGVIAGVFVDRWRLKPTMVVSDSIRAGLVLLLLLATETWHFYLALGIISIVSSFFGPAQGVAVRSAVPLNGIRSAEALMQQVTFGMRIIGPAIAVFLVASVGAASCYILDSVSFVGSACLIASVTFRRTADTSPGKPTAGPGAPGLSPMGKVWHDMREGLNFIFHDAGLLFVIVALTAGMFVIGCFAPLTALYVRDDLHASTRLFGIVSALVGVGMVIGINALSTLAKNAKNTVLVYSGLAGIALGLLLLAGIPAIWSALLGEFIIGFAFAAIFIPSETMIQMETPPALLGRVGSTVMSVIFAAQIAGLVLSGILAEYIGVRPVFAICAMILAILISIGYVWMKPKTQMLQPKAS